MLHLPLKTLSQLFHLFNVFGIAEPIVNVCFYLSANPFEAFHKALPLDVSQKPVVDVVLLSGCLANRLARVAKELVQP